MPAAALLESDPECAIDEALAEMERRRQARAAVDAHLATCQVCAHEAMLCSQGRELVHWAVG